MLLSFFEIDFLGQKVTPASMSPIEEKIRAAREWERPNDVTDVWSFLGFANFYQCYIYKFAEISAHLTQLTKKEDPSEWESLQSKAFLDLKIALFQAPMLTHLAPDLVYTVITDASKIAVGRTLMQDHGEGLRPIAFMSRTLSPAERKYSDYEHELAAIAFRCVKWRHYLAGCPEGVKLVTDHKTVMPLMSQEVLSWVQARWLRQGFFQSINPRIQCTSGKANIVADALPCSQGLDPRRWSHAPNLDHGSSVAALTQISIVLIEELATWKIAQEGDPVLWQILH